MPANSEPLPAPRHAANPEPSPAPPSAEAGDTGGEYRRAVVLPEHLHARPAGRIAQAAARHRPTTIELVAGTRRANARSVLSVMALGAVAGSEVQISVTGPGAEAVLIEIVEILLAPED
jgi:phosphocarrier protein HPr